VAAPISTVDLGALTATISYRAAQPEGSHSYRREADGSDGVSIENPAFDVTPAKYVAAIITERGIAREPYQESLQRLAGAEAKSRSSV